MHGHTPMVSQFHVFGCKCFILKKGKKLDKFEARLVDGIVGDSPRGPLKQRGNPHLKPATKPKHAKPNHAGA
jgi:hypothetical protein